MAAPPELLERLLRPLNATGISYMVTGGFAAIVYGEPRLTNDVDIVIHLSAGDAHRLHDAFDSEEYYVPVPPLEVIKAEAARGAFGHFNILHVSSALRADVYCVGDDAFGAWALSRRRTITIAGEPVALAPLEYVIVMKLRYYRDSGSERHLRDVAAMHRVSGEFIDSQSLASWVERFSVHKEWEAAQGAD